MCGPIAGEDVDKPDRATLEQAIKTVKANAKQALKDFAVDIKALEKQLAKLK